MISWANKQENKGCQQLLVPEKVIDCLLDPFQHTNDGWVTLNRLLKNSDAH